MVGGEEGDGEEDDLGDGDAVAEADDAVAGTHNFSGEEEIIGEWHLALSLVFFFFSFFGGGMEVERCFPLSLDQIQGEREILKPDP